MTRHRLLVVDDNALLASILAEAGATAGYDTRALSDSRDFMQVYGEFRPSLLIIDLTMPYRDGTELLRLLAKVRCDAGILLFGRDELLGSVAVRFGNALGLKMPGTILKPTTPTRLVELLETVRYGESEPYETLLLTNSLSAVLAGLASR